MGLYGYPQMKSFYIKFFVFKSMVKKGSEELAASATQLFKISFNQPYYRFAEFSLLWSFNCY